MSAPAIFKKNKKKIAASDTKLATTWCTDIGEIRTVYFIVYFFKGDCLSSVFVIECDHHTIVVKINRIDKAVDQSAAVFKFLDVHLPQAVKSKQYLIFCQRRLRDFFLCDLHGNITFQLLQFLKSLFCGFRNDPLLDRIEEVIDRPLRLSILLM